MRKFVSEFFRRGLIAFGFGPLVLAVIYLILQRLEVLSALSVGQICIGIGSTALLAFVAGGINAIYQIERLPLLVAILLHGIVLYFAYLATYLVNNWLQLGTLPIVVFTGIFVVGYIVIWAIIYGITKKTTKKLNESLKKKQQHSQN